MRDNGETLKASMFGRYYDVRYVWSVGTDDACPGQQKVYAASAAQAAGVVRRELRHADSLSIHSVATV